ncbi:MAG: LPS export ABC transporter ATP-binding protein [Gammaproteobacteria bacterium]|jgi:lipopolysaccharide export system ATP-binding protein|nr:LPS export ABC transporter ATP-binding protein [Gammaproteobacteria bacterium]MBT3723505.1 LPS export ABC transporter ATP-binding protein [Gammaproteobacteria bacterium]MBT4194287.1 LPS export ABC transporter ATP-binding protein [Gammaproteobacteria bacterium]MBT4450841.1 LPS export ABC transporter ATP-binding protein [Gammaproteobacteria bacterium]MBT4859716.1 LPS export ABC transporter ATP-binding protein [Gammaproteobacteria bacterium]
MDSENELKATNLAKSYKGREVVKSVSLSVQSGQIIGLLGPNGAGKTTCFYMIVGLINIDSGSIELNGQPISHLPMHKRAQQGIGYLPQEASIFRGLSVQDNIRAILQMRQDLNAAQQDELLEQLLEDFQVQHIRDNLGISLSGGERRRVEIARALANEPQFILLDEPFAGVDPISVIDIQSIIRQLAQRGIGILITDHNVRETLGVCDRAYVMGEGTVLAEGDPDHVLADKIVRKIYLGKDFKL